MGHMASFGSMAGLGGRRRLAAVIASLALVATLAPMTGVDAAGRVVPPRRGRETAVLRADGLRQDAVEHVRDAGRRARLPRAVAATAPRHPTTACSRRRRRTRVPVGSRWRPARGRASTARRTTRSTSTAKRSPTALRRWAPPACCRPRRWPRRPSAAARRSPRSSGPAVAAARSRPDARLPQLPHRSRCRDQLHQPRRLGDVHHRLRSAVRPSRRVRQHAAVPAGRADTSGRLDERAEVVQPAEGDAPSRHRRRRRQVRPQRLHLRQHATTAAPGTTGCSSRRRRTATTRSPT